MTHAHAELEITPEWCTHHFNHLAHGLGEEIYSAFDFMRDTCPVARSDQHGGFWLITRYRDVLQAAQDWQSFSSAQGVTVPMSSNGTPIIPEMIDPPLHREYRRLINAWFTQARVAQYEGDVRVIVNRLIDEVIEAGRCDFMDAFARPFPGAVFFELVLHAPPDEAPAIVAAASAISADPAGSGEHRGVIMKWIHDLVEQRRGGPRQNDVVDAVIHAEIEGRPITDLEITAIIQLLIFGGLDTTAGALGQMMMRFCRQPEIPALLRERPELVPDAVEELLRLDGPLAYLGRTATRDVELGGSLVKEGDKVLVGWMSANRDGDEFEQPEMFDLERPSNRHLAFGAGPHRCAGSNLARMDLRIAVGELARRFHDLTLEEQSPIPFHSGFSRAPAQLEISFQPAARESQAVGS